MSEQTAAKVTGAQLARTAYLYVRQSTLRQVLTNTESAARQYALRQKAIALGWDAEHIVTIEGIRGVEDLDSVLHPGVDDRTEGEAHLRGAAGSGEPVGGPG